MAAERVALPPPDRAGGMTLAAALVRWRSVRAFAARALCLNPEGHVPRQQGVAAFARRARTTRRPSANQHRNSINPSPDGQASVRHEARRDRAVDPCD